LAQLEYWRHWKMETGQFSRTGKVSRNARMPRITKECHPDESTLNVNTGRSRRGEFEHVPQGGGRPSGLMYSPSPSFWGGTRQRETKENRTVRPIPPARILTRIPTHEDGSDDAPEPCDP
jgi:hypothetical protein